MNLYFELQKSPVFTMEDAAKYYNNIESARSAVKRLIKKDMVKKYEKICTLVSVEKVESRSQTGFRSEVRFLKLHISRIIQPQNTMA